MVTILGCPLHERIVGVSVDLADRYGTRRKRRPVLIGVVIVVAAALLGWLFWAAAVYFSPQVSSEVNRWSIEDEHSTTVVARVSLADDVDTPLCRVRVLAEDKSAVGELQFTPVDGVNEVTVSTERRGASVDWIGCTSKDQRRPQ